jgi:hypothetical protein
MPRAFTDTDLVQFDGGTTTIDATSVPVSLPNGVQDGSSGIIVVGSPNPWEPPTQWHPIVKSGSGSETSPSLVIMCRANLAVGETDWSFDLTSPVNAMVCWTVEEWKNISYCPLVAKGINWDPATPVASLALTATQAGLDPGYTLGIAALFVKGSPSAGAWSAVTWSNGFTEQYVQTMGPGSDATSSQLRVARRYGAASETGSWATTATFTGGVQTGKVFYGGLAILRAENHEGDI